MTASLLARHGLKTMLVEKNPRCGGRLGSEHLARCRFDIGPSLLLLPQSYRATYALLGEELSDHLDLLPVDPFYRCFFAEDPASFLDIARNQSYESFGEGSSRQVEEYLRISSSFLDFGLPNVIEERFTAAKLLPFLAACAKAFPLLPHSAMLERYFSSKKIRAAMSFQNLYVGLSPYNAPSIFSLLQALEFDQGIFYPRGGFQAVADSLEKIARKNGVDIRMKHRLCAFHRSASGDRVNHALVHDEAGGGEHLEISAETFVSNIDVPSNEYYLSPTASSSKPAPSCSVLQFHFAFDIELPMLKHHNIFFAPMDQQARSWLLVEQPDKADVFDIDNFNFYLHAPSRTDRSVCAEGGDAITVLVPLSPLPDHQDQSTNADPALYRAVRSRVLQRIASAAQLPSSAIEQHLTAEQMRSAYDWRDAFDLYRGAAFGLRHSLDQLAIFRPGFRDPQLRNLYRVGASTRPGNGVPLVMIGARLAAKTILRDLGIEGAALQ